MGGARTALTLLRTTSIYTARFRRYLLNSHNCELSHNSDNLSAFASHFPILEASNYPTRYFSSSNLVPGLSLELSQELEAELKSLNTVSSHENVIYILRKLDKDPDKSAEFFNWIRLNKWFVPNTAVYSLLLRTFVNGKSMKSFWAAIREMKEAGCFIDKETYLTILAVFKNAKMASDASAFTHFYDRMVQDNAMDAIVKKVADVVAKLDWNSRLEEELRELNIPLSDNFILHTLKELRGSPGNSLKFFHWVRDGLGYSHNGITYNGVCRVIGSRESIKEFWEVVEEMGNMGFEIDIDTYIKISRQFQKSKMMEDAVMLYELMMNGSFKPSTQDCVLLLRAISNCNPPNLDLVFRVSKKYEAMGGSLPKGAYDGIHRSLTSIGNFDEAERIIETMGAAGYAPDNITYSQLVFGLCKLSRLDEARGVLNKMVEHGCHPDLKTWTVLIKGCCLTNNLAKALLYFSDMLDQKCDPDADLLGILVNAFIYENNISGAYGFLMEMVVNAQLRPWQSTFKNLILGLLKEKKLEEGLEVLGLMKKHGYPPFPEPFDDYISKFGSVDDASKFLTILSFKDYPPMLAYIRILRSFAQEGRQSEAKDLLFKCPHHVRTNAEVCKLFGAVENTSL